MNRASGDAANGFRFHYTADAECRRVIWNIKSVKKTKRPVWQ